MGKGKNRVVTLASGKRLTGRAAKEYGSKRHNRALKSGVSTEEYLKTRGLNDVAEEAVEAPQLPETPGLTPIEPEAPPVAPETPQGGVQPGQVSQEQALANLRSGGLQGDQLAQAEKSLANSYQVAHQQQVSGGGVPPMTQGEFQNQVDTGALATTEQSLTQKSPLDLALEENPIMAELIAQMQDYNKLENRRGTLVEEWQAMRDATGVEDLNLEAMNLKNVIEGSEDDIRTEITKAGGFATDSQVLALTNARNKDNIKAYNRLMDTIDAKEKTINTMMGLEVQDRQMASQRFMNMFNMTAQVAQFQQQFVRDAKDSLKWTASLPGGFDAIARDALTNPQTLKYVNQMFGGLDGLHHE